MKYKYCHIARKYMDDVLNDKVMVGELTKQAVRRQLKDEEVAPEMGWYFDKDTAEAAIKYKTNFSHTYGEMAGQAFEPEPWQCFMDYCVYGWKKADGRRRFSTAYIEVAKKNGKTAKIALDGVYMLAADTDTKGNVKHGVEVYCAATMERQAKEVFNQAKDYIEGEPDFKEYYQPNIVTNNISIRQTLSKFEPLGRDSKGKDGKRPDGVIIDEYHEWDKDDVRFNLRTASVGKPQYLEWIITTAGFNKFGPCYTWRRYCLDVLYGINTQHDVFVLIFALDEGDDWKDETIWPKANPNYGISVDVENLKKLFAEALNRGGQTEVNFKTKNLNMWVDAPTVWIRDEKFMACSHNTTDKDLEGYPCFAGGDFAKGVDINAVVLYFPETAKGTPAYKAWFWIPENKMIEQADRVDYRLWVQKNLVITCPGDIIDEIQMVDDIHQIFINHNVQTFSYDPHRSLGGIVQGLIRKGYDDDFLYPFSQAIGNMTAPTRAFETELQASNVELFQNPVMRWMLRNVYPWEDANQNIKLKKLRSEDKIDGIIAAINARGGYMNAQPVSSNPGIITLDFEF